ncbi:hypothetical protein LEP1GSC150_5621 [Leptospira interrogans serovar Copenhageni str. LT2050]|uniref:Uncharacterized protein n=1 Tax=Leptospira interrogans serovar Copenhageni str. LT2050 TaxID=1001598 RepID=M3G8J3_LEPIT|nr:hypothetical protein LEP1GSC150_5621 [Leptospira interrogans serovar Copenhageni str. LT2050]
MEIHSVISESNSNFQIELKTGETLEFNKILFATGSGRKAWNWLDALGHTIVEPVPSLFTLKFQMLVWKIYLDLLLKMWNVRWLNLVIRN